MEHAPLPHKKAPRRSRKRGDLMLKLMRGALIYNIICGIACIVTGALLHSHVLPFNAERYIDGNVCLNLNPPFTREVFLLLLNIIFIGSSVGASGRAHGEAVKWKLAFEDDKQTGNIRLEFNSNLRFLQSSYEWWSATGLPANVIMTLCLTVSYASSSMVLLNLEQKDVAYNAIVSFVAIYVLGCATLVQSAIAFYAIHTTKILTWDRSPFDTAAVLVREHRLKRAPGRCMHSLFDQYRDGPIEPRERQESAWVSHPQFRGLVMYTWLLVAAGYYWAFIIWGMMDSGTQGSHRGNSWAPIPWAASNSSFSLQSGNKDTGSMNFGWEGEAPTAGLLWSLGILVGFQGGILTTAMTCAHALASMVRDEHLWREAGKDCGSDPSPGSLKRICISWQTIAIFIVEPFIHWLFGLSISFDADVGFQLRPVQILYVAIVGTVGVIVIVIEGKRRPRTTQPSTYGHLQTLVNLIDEWHEKMYWGHKYDGHAGTSDHLLESIDMKSLYGFKDLKDC